MAGETFVYSFENVAVTINGLKVDGFFEGDNAVEIAPRSDNGTEVVGADGSATFSYSADDSVMITLRLQPSSRWNARLEDIHRRARVGGRIGGVPIVVRDTSNGEGGVAAEAHVKTAPTRQLGTNATERVWVLWANAWTWNKIDYVEPA